MQAPDAAIVDAAKWLGGGMAWLISVVVTYKLGKRAKVDDLRIKRRHELVEQVAIALQQDHELREALMEQYEGNFGHLDRQEANAAFQRHESLYQSMRERVERTSETKTKLHTLAQEGAVYFEKSISELLAQYLKATQFAYMTDGMGGWLINTYAKSFFDNLLEERNVEERREAFNGAMERLRKVKH